MADERAEKGRLSEAVPIYPGPKKYGSLQLRMKASLRAQVAKDKLNAPLPQILRQNIRVSYEHSIFEILLGYVHS